MTKKTPTDTNNTQISNPKLRDSSSKLIFGDNTLSSQFLRDYADLEILRHVQPEDLEDVSERYVPLYSTERNSDTIKRVNISRYLPPQSEHANPLDLPLYIISLVEHKSKVEYNVIMQLLRYMVYIWEDFEKEMEKIHPGISKRKDFRYPPILPILYYEGTDSWTAVTDLADKILYGELLGKYLPHFQYQLVTLHDYSNEELLAKGDEISLTMLINKIQTLEDVSAFSGLPAEQISDILKDTPEHLLDKMAHVLRALLYRMELPKNTVEETVTRIKERKMGMLFENIQMNFEDEKRKTAEVQAKLDAAQQELYTAQLGQNIYKHILRMVRQGASDEEITQSLARQFSLSQQQAEEKLALAFEE